jgi:hypothetical protein
VIESGQITGTGEYEFLLNFALAPLIPCSEKHERGWLLNRDFEIFALLLDNGADFIDEYEITCLWGLVVTYMIVRVDSLDRNKTRLLHYKREYDPIETSDMILVSLRILAIFAERAPHRHECSEISVCVHLSSKSLTISEALRKFILEGNCCGGSRLLDCRCHQANAWRPLALKILRLTEASRESKDTVEGMAPPVMNSRRDTRSATVGKARSSAGKSRHGTFATSLTTLKATRKKFSRAKKVHARHYRDQN